MEFWVAVYGAVLSTLIALASAISWIFRVRLTVYGLHPYETWTKTCQAVVVNSGTRPTSVRCVVFEAFERRFFRGKAVWRLVADHAHIMDPAIKKVPVPGKDNQLKRVPNVLNPGEEYIGSASAEGEYQPEKHWLRVSAYARGSSIRFYDWVAPRKLEEG